MYFHITGIYCEVGIRFNISHKAKKLIRDALRERVFTHPMYVTKLPDKKHFSVEIGAKEAINAITVYEPKVSENGINVYVLLPYQTIKEAPDELEAFVKHFFVALDEVFRKYEISYYGLAELEQEVLAEVVGNEEYKYVDPAPWLTESLEPKPNRKSDT